MQAFIHSLILLILSYTFVFSLHTERSQARHSLLGQRNILILSCSHPLRRIYVPVQIHTLQRHHLRAEPHLVPDKQGHKDDQTNIARKEVARVPVDKHRKAIRHQDQHVEEQAVPRQPRLAGRQVRQVREGDALRAQGLPEADVARVDERPRDEARHGRDVEQPREHLGAAGREVEEADQAEQRRERHGDVRRAVVVCAREQGGRVALFGEGDHDAAA